jgi:hypothetical protein
VEKPLWICEDKEANSTSNGLILDDRYEFKFQNKHLQSPILRMGKTYNEYTRKFDYLIETKMYFRALTAGQVNLINI